MVWVQVLEKSRFLTTYPKVEIPIAVSYGWVATLDTFLDNGNEFPWAASRLGGVYWVDDATHSDPGLLSGI